MSSRLLCLLTFSYRLLGLAQAQNDGSSTDPCAAAASSQSASLQGLNLGFPGDILYASIDAATAFECMASVPFVADDATDLISLAQSYFAFDTTLAYLKDPPAAYQQPPVDVMGRLQLLSQNITNGAYQNQYQFDYDIYRLVSDTHEEHFNLNAGVLGLFTFLLPDGFVSVSSDGKELPQVYAYSDIMDNVNDASPIVSVDGLDTFDWLQMYAAAYTQIGDIEPHADYNVLMSNPSYQFDLQVDSGLSFWPSWVQGTTVYYGPWLNGTFANGSNFNWPYTAGSFNSLSEQDLTSGQSIYQNFVANTAMVTAIPTVAATAALSTAFATSEIPAYATPTLSSTITPPTYTAVPYPNYPQDPDVIQANFGNDGSVSGYLLQDISVGVLSLPSFVSGQGKDTSPQFSAAVAQFISDAQQAGMKKIIVDVQGNGGGSVMQGFDTFRQFFPTTTPSLGMRTRATPQLNTLGSIVTTISMAGDSNSSDIVNSIDSGLGGVGILDAAFTMTPDGLEWASWENFFGPRTVYNDNFTNTYSLNFSSFFGTANGFGQFVTGFGNNTVSYDQPWAAEDIMILSDGQCGSTCSIFAELMKTDGGVKSVVVGGIPETGPMQSVCGTRGANVQDWATISQLVDEVNEIIDTYGSEAETTLEQGFGLTMDDIQALPRPLELARYNIRAARFNAVDEIRASSPDDPLQFTYEAANCRLFYTAPMIRDITQLWRAVANVMNGDMSACVDGSTDAAGSSTNDTVTDGIGSNSQSVWEDANTTTNAATGTGSQASSTSSSAAITGMNMAAPGSFLALLTMVFIGI